MKRVMMAHIVGLLLCAVFCISVWWYFVYMPLRASLRVPEQSDTLFVAKEAMEYITTASLVSLLLHDAETAGLTVVGCVSGETEENSAVSIQVQTKKWASLAHFFLTIIDHLPSVQCTAMTIKSFDASQDERAILEAELQFSSLHQLANELIIAPELFERDPFCSGSDCRVIAQGYCADLGLTFHVKKQGDQVFIERVVK